MEYINFQSRCDLKNVELKVDYSLTYSHEQTSHIEPKDFNKTKMSEGEVVTLNVGGRLFTTTRTTLTSEPHSVLGRMFDPTSPLPPARTIDGAYFIDANPAIFEVPFFVELSLPFFKGGAGFPPSQMHFVTPKFAHGSRFGPSKVSTVSVAFSGHDNFHRDMIM